VTTRADAPPPGWYPDPEGGARLRWWHGTDWSDRYRPPPTEAELHRIAGLAATSDRPAATPAGAPTTSGERRAVARSEVEAIVAEVRQAARSEVQRAADVFSQRARAATRELQPLVTEYTNRIVRWLRIIVIIVILAVIAWFVFEAIAQVTFFDWLGERIDNLTN
jgi:hypothetical protein